MAWRAFSVPNNKTEHLMETRNTEKRHAWPCFDRFSSVERGGCCVSLTLSCWRGDITQERKEEKSSEIG